MPALACLKELIVVVVVVVVTLAPAPTIT